MRKEFTDAREGIGVSSGIRARSTSNWRLVNINDFVKKFNALNSIVRARLSMSTIQGMSQFPVHDVGNEGALARAGNTCNHNKFPEWNIDRNIFEIILARARNSQGPSIAFTTYAWQWNTLAPGWIIAGEGIRIGKNIFVFTFSD